MISTDIKKPVITMLSLLLLASVLSACSHSQPVRSEYENARHYVVVDVEVNELEKYEKFLALEAPILKKYGAYMEMDIRSKDQKKRYLIVSFPSFEADLEFVKSKEFQAILPLGITSAKSKIFHGYMH
ncbi:MAG: DUF1330 domain-containing protein [Pseudomonadota bacterium]